MARRPMTSDRLRLRYGKEMAPSSDEEEKVSDEDYLSEGEQDEEAMAIISARQELDRANAELQRREEELKTLEARRRRSRIRRRPEKKAAERKSKKSKPNPSSRPSRKKRKVAKSTRVTRQTVQKRVEDLSTTDFEKRRKEALQAVEDTRRIRDRHGTVYEKISDKAYNKAKDRLKVQIKKMLNAPMTSITRDETTVYQHMGTISKESGVLSGMDVLNTLRSMLRSRAIGGERFALTVGSGSTTQYFTMNEASMSRLLEAERDKDEFLHDYDGVFDSSQMFVVNLSGSNLLGVARILSQGQYRRAMNVRSKYAGNFGYLVNHRYSLEDFGIFKNLTTPEAINSDCFMLALKAHGFNEAELNYVKHLIPNSSVCIKSLAYLGTSLSIQFRVFTASRCNDELPRRRMQLFPKECKFYIPEKIIDLGLINRHWFAIKKLKITQSAFRHNSKRCKWERNRRRRGKQKSPPKFIDSFMAVNMLNHYREKHPDSTLARAQEKISCNTAGFDDLTCSMNSLHRPNDENCTVYELELLNKVKKSKDAILVEYKEKKEVMDFAVIDIETRTKGMHLEYAASMCVGDNCEEGGYRVTYEINSTNPTASLLRQLDGPRSLVYAHNLGYDASKMLKNFQYFTQYCEKGTSLISATGVVSTKPYHDEWKPDKEEINMITLRCSYKALNMPLRDVGKAFGLNVEKQVMPYTIPNLGRYVPLERCQLDPIFWNLDGSFNSINWEKFLKNLMSWEKTYYPKTGVVDIYKYGSYYCNMDVVVTWKGLKKWQEYGYEQLDLDVLGYATLPSLANGYLTKSGVYEGCYKIKISPCLNFLHKTVKGGRSALANNRMQLVNLDFRVPNFEEIILEEKLDENFMDYMETIIEEAETKEGKEALIKAMNPLDRQKEMKGELDRLNSERDLDLAKRRGDYVAMLGESKVNEECIVNEECKVNESKKETFLNVLLDMLETTQSVDVTSLYPWAMSEMSGYLKGTPKLLNTPRKLTQKFLDSVDGYFIKVRVIAINKRRRFPLESYVDSKTKTRIYSNDLVGKEIYLCKFAAEDFIEFHSAKYKILGGYYFNEGRNTTIKSVMRYLFSKRKELKAKNNPAQLVLKYIMNMGYGYSLTKPTKRETHIFKTRKKYEEFVVSNWEAIVDGHGPHGGVYIVRTRPHLKEHSNMAHIGSEVLAFSKRRMNRVMCLAEDLGMDIYYQDTDSCHIKQKHLYGLGKAFELKYGEKLFGKNLGMMHAELEYNPKKHEVTSTENICVCQEIENVDVYPRKISDFYNFPSPTANPVELIGSVKDYHLAKKVYLKIIMAMKIGKESDKVYLNMYFKLKGIPQSTVLYEANHQFSLGGEKNPNRLHPIEALYLWLAKGKYVEFDLLEGGRKARFEKKMGQYYTKERMIRRVGFPDNRDEYISSWCISHGVTSDVISYEQSRLKDQTKSIFDQPIVKFDLAMGVGKEKIVSLEL